MCYIQYCFFPSRGGADYVLVGLSLIKQIIKDVNLILHCIQCQTATDILEIENDFAQYVQNHFQYV